MEDLYVDNGIESGAAGNAEFLAMMEKICKELRRLRKKKVKAGRKARKKKPHRFHYMSVQGPIGSIITMDEKIAEVQ
jgi:hypothetical protein